MHLPYFFQHWSETAAGFLIRHGWCGNVPVHQSVLGCVLPAVPGVVVLFGEPEQR